MPEVVEVRLAILHGTEDTIVVLVAKPVKTVAIFCMPLRTNPTRGSVGSIDLGISGMSMCPPVLIGISKAFWIVWVLADLLGQPSCQRHRPGARLPISLSMTAILRWRRLFRIASASSKPAALPMVAALPFAFHRERRFAKGEAQENDTRSSDHREDCLRLDL